MMSLISGRKLRKRFLITVLLLFFILTGFFHTDYLPFLRCFHQQHFEVFCETFQVASDARELEWRSTKRTNAIPTRSVVMGSIHHKMWLRGGIGLWNHNTVIFFFEFLFIMPSNKSKKKTTVVKNVRRWNRAVGEAKLFYLSLIVKMWFCYGFCFRASRGKVDDLNMALRMGSIVSLVLGVMLVRAVAFCIGSSLAKMKQQKSRRSDKKTHLPTTNPVSENFAIS